jgi:aspartyl-tRNA(Asn)/glutamyl-tRNA(Gln) amidotransferase subunit C
VSVDSKTVKQIATLARLRVADEDVEAVAAELSSILTWVEQLSEVDTASVVPMTSVSNAQPAYRQDEITDGGAVSNVLSNAPDSVEEFYSVPKVVE